LFFIKLSGVNDLGCRITEVGPILHCLNIVFFLKVSHLEDFLKPKPFFPGHPDCLDTYEINQFISDQLSHNLIENSS
jgi:hypothetical protein